jgi:hypothetical protein
MELLHIETSTNDITIRIASASKVELLTTPNMAILSIRQQWTSLLCLLIASLHIQSTFALDIAYCSTQNTGGGASPGKLYLPLPIRLVTDFLIKSIRYFNPMANATISAWEATPSPSYKARTAGAPITYQRTSNQRASVIRHVLATQVTFAETKLKASLDTLH